MLSTPCCAVGRSLVPWELSEMRTWTGQGHEDKQDPVPERVQAQELVRGKGASYQTASSRMDQIAVAFWPAAVAPAARNATDIGW